MVTKVQWALETPTMVFVNNSKSFCHPARSWWQLDCSRWQSLRERI